MNNEAISALTAAFKKADVAKPSAADRAELDRVLKQYPQLWRAAGDLMEQTARQFAKEIGGTYAIRASFTAAWEQLPRELARPGDGELERLLVQQVALAWLKLAYVEYYHARSLLDGSLTIAQAEFRERRLSAAQRRYLRAIETLARVRRLNLPALQVNIGAQQVNQVNPSK